MAVARVHEVLGGRGGEVAADGAGEGIVHLGRADEARTSENVLSAGPSTTIAKTGERVMNVTSSS